MNDDFYDGGNEILSSNDPAHLEIGARAHQEGTIGVLAGQLGLIAQYARDYPDIPYLVKPNSKSHMVKTHKEILCPRRFGIGRRFWLCCTTESTLSESDTLYTLVQSMSMTCLLKPALSFDKARTWNDCSCLDVPKGQAVSDEKDPQLISGAAGVAACIGADFAKVNYPRAFDGMTQPESLGIAAEAAGRCGIICSGGGSLLLRNS